MLLKTLSATVAFVAATTVIGTTLLFVHQRERRETEGFFEGLPVSEVGRLLVARMDAAPRRPCVAKPFMTDEKSAAVSTFPSVFTPLRSWIRPVSAEAQCYCIGHYMDTQPLNCGGCMFHECDIGTEWANGCECADSGCGCLNDRVCDNGGGH